MLVEKGDTRQLAVLNEARPWHAFQYQRRQLFLLSTAELARLSPGQQQVLTIRDDLNLIRLRNLFFDTTVEQPEVPENLRRGEERTGQLHLVQFVGPVQNDWIAQVRRIEGLQVVTYAPENAYLIWADARARESASTRLLEVA